jgi:hypothetical protein
MKTRRRTCVSSPSLAAACMVAALCQFGPITEAAQVTSPLPAESCASAEECFTAAAWPKERLGNQLTKDQVNALKLERLRRVMERYPASLWAKRAGLLSGRCHAIFAGCPAGFPLAG